MHRISVSRGRRNFTKILIILRYSLLQYGILIISISLFIGTWGRGTPEAYAEPLKKHLALFRYDGFHLQPIWSENGEFSEILEKDLGQQSTDHLSKQADLKLTNILTGLAKKIQVAFSPQVIVKPSIAIKELQNNLLIYQTHKIRKQILVDEKFQAKTLLQPNQIARLKKLKNLKPFSLAPYRNRIYGIHIQITW